MNGGSAQQWYRIATNLKAGPRDCNSLGDLLIYLHLAAILYAKAYLDITELTGWSLPILKVGTIWYSVCIGAQAQVSTMQYRQDWCH